MTKRLHLLFLLAALVFALVAAACGGDDDENNDENSNDPTPTAGAASPTTAATQGSTSPTARASAATGEDQEYITTVCEAGAAFVDELARAATAYSEEVGQTQDPAIIGAGLQKHLAPPFRQFLTEMQAAEPPADVVDYNDQIISQLERVTAKLEAADPTALGEITESQLNNPPDDVANRLNSIAANDPNCLKAGFFIGDPNG